nr:hypothetical protein GCM10025699_73860 [Microbacterium flavescens]
MLNTNEVTTALNAAEPQSQSAHEITRRRGIGAVSASVCAAVMGVNLVGGGVRREPRLLDPRPPFET